MRLFIPVFLFIIFGCASSDKMEGNLNLKDLLSGNINGWHADGNVDAYDRETIFRYMDGAGEIYRMYDYRAMQVLRMIKNAEAEIKVEMFDMGSPEDAYGVFCHMREGDDAGVGEGSEYRKGLLCFWQAKYFFCLTAEKETPDIKEAIFQIANTITGLIKPSCIKPAIVDLLPEKNLNIITIRYFNLPSSLNYHYFVSEDNLLNLNEETEAVLAQYGTGCYLLCVRYPGIEKSKTAFNNFLSGYLPEAKVGGTYKIADSKWVTAENIRNYIIIIFDSPGEQFSAELLKAIKTKIG